MSVKQSLKYLVLATFFCLLQSANASAYSYNLSANTIFRQAKQENFEYFRLLKRYPRAIDISDNKGDTAYCLAIRSNDVQVMRFLAMQGANVRHSCVDRIQNEIKQAKSLSRNTNTVSSSTSRKFRDDGFFADDKNVWYTAAALAAGGGLVAVLAGNGGGGSHHSGGGSDSGGGGGGGDTPIDPVGELVDTTVEDFETQEYKNMTLLEGINAAKAYTHIFKKDEEDHLFSHQAKSDNRLKTVNVGVIDTGMYANQDLKGKITKNYDINIHNGENSAWIYVISPASQAYVLKHHGSYYGAIFSSTGNDIWVNSNGGLDFNEADIKAMVEQELGISFSEMTLMNGSGGNPGRDFSNLVISRYDLDSISEWRSLMRELSHGTHVGGIIAANRDGTGVHGVAFENARLYNASWDFGNSDILDVVKDMVDNDVDVISNSWGQDTEDGWSASSLKYYIDNSWVADTRDAYIYAANHKTVWVQAAGNESYSDAQLWAGLGALDLSSYGYSGPGEYEVPYLAVVALSDATKNSTAPAGKLASYSNYCGSVKNYCIAAPGTNIESTAASEQGDMLMSGTSMATPVVSGSIALLNGYYPWLSAQNVAYILLETANNRGEYADSNKYGRGALDLEAAITTPVGSLKLAEDTGFTSLSPVSSNRLALSGAMQTKMLKAMPKSVTAFDALNRPFDYNVSNLVSKTHGSNANLRNEVSHAAMPNSQKTIRDEKTGFSFTSENASNKKGEEKLSFAEVTRETDDGASTRLYYAENSKYATSENVLKPTSNPYLAMNEAYGAENTLKLNDVSKLKLSLQTGENGLYERDYEQDRHSFDERSYAINAEYSFNMTDYLELATVGGMLYEENAMLGMNGKGGFAIKDGSTYYMGLKAVLNLTDNISLMAAYYRGYTQGQEASLLALSNMVTESYMIAGEYQFNQQNKVGLSLSSPISVVKGKATFNYATGRDNYSDTVYMKKLTSSLKPVAKEYDLGLYYKGIPQEDLSLLGKVEARFNADGEKGVTDYIGIIGISAAF